MGEEYHFCQEQSCNFSLQVIATHAKKEGGIGQVGAGYVMKIEREKRGYLQFREAQRLGVSPAALCRYENEIQDVPLDVVANAVRLYRCPEIADAQCASCPVARARQDIKQKWPLGRGLRKVA